MSIAGLALAALVGAPLAAASDSTRLQVSWRGNDDVSELSGKVVQLHFELQNAKLFALQFGPES